MKGTVIIIKKGKKVVLHTKLQRFSTIEERDQFIGGLKKAFSDKRYIINHYTISKDPIEPTEAPKRGHKYCPYCTETVKLKIGDFGSKICPICGISEQDFYFKKYNNIK